MGMCCFKMMVNPACRCAAELQRRCDTLIRLIEKENSDTRAKKKSGGGSLEDGDADDGDADGDEEYDEDGKTKVCVVVRVLLLLCLRCGEDVPFDCARYCCCCCCSHCRSARRLGMAHR